MVATLALVLSAIAFSLWYFSPAGVQARGMREARRHIDTVLAAAISVDPRFKDITLSVSTTEGGAVAVLGQVQTWNDARALRELVAGTRPTVPVSWGGLMVVESLDVEAPDPSLTKRVTRPDEK